jgi:hypothetical protein
MEKYKAIFCLQVNFSIVDRTQFLSFRNYVIMHVIYERYTFCCHRVKRKKKEYIFIVRVIVSYDYNLSYDYLCENYRMIFASEKNPFILLFFCLWSLYCLSFDLPRITPLVSFRNTFSRIGVECTLYLI